jgi:tetratricopeptide (TPR) repeat protein
LGDAFGETWLGRPTHFAEQAISRRWIPGGPWHWTDDTTMALSLVAVRSGGALLPVARSVGQLDGRGRIVHTQSMSKRELLRGDGFAVRVDAAGEVEAELHIDGAAVLRARAAGLLAAGDVDNAIVVLTLAKECDPDDPDVAYELAAALDDAGRYPEALAEADRGATLRPDEPRHVTNRGIVRSHAGDYPGAIADFDLAVAMVGASDADLTEARHARADALYCDGQYERALAEVTLVTRDDPQHPHAWFLRGLAEVRLERYEDAIDSFSRDVDAGSPSSVTYLHRARMYILLGRRALAVDDIATAEALSDGPSVPDTVARLRAQIAQLDATR